MEDLPCPQLREEKFAVDEFARTPRRIGWAGNIRDFRALGGHKKCFEERGGLFLGEKYFIETARHASLVA